MDRGDEASGASSRSSRPAGATPHSYPTLDRPSDSFQAPPLDGPSDSVHTMDVDEVTSPASQSTEDMERGAKKARFLEAQTTKRSPPRGFARWGFPEPYWLRLNPAVYQMDERLARRARELGGAIREQLRRLNRLEYYYSEEEDMALIKKAKEVMPSQPEQAELPEGFPCSNNTNEEYARSDEFIKQADKRVKLYFSTVKSLSQKEVIANGFRHMKDEAFLAFEHYVAEKDLVEGFDYKFGELLHHCFTFEEYRKVYCHYNFTIEMKKEEEETWSTKQYFAEAKMIQGVKYYFCSPTEATDDGPCYSCKNQGILELKHPSGGGYEVGHKGSGAQGGYPDDDADECGFNFGLFD